MNEAVADAGPLIHLAEIDSLALLLTFDALHVPDAVWMECIRPGRVLDTALRRLNNLQHHFLEPAEVFEFVVSQNLTQLDVGEQEALCLSHKLGTSVLLTDDLAVRDTAKRLGLRPIGSLGIAVRAYQRGLITLSEAEKRIVALYSTSSLFVTWAIVEIAIEQLRQHRR